MERWVEGELRRERMRFSRFELGVGRRGGCSVSPSLLGSELHGGLGSLGVWVVGGVDGAALATDLCLRVRLWISAAYGEL